MYKLHFGSANFLDLSGERLKRPVAPLNIYDPIAVKAALGLNTLEVFPLITVGVRWWPFLFLARDYQSRKAPNLSPIVNRQKEVFRYGGPETASSFDRYKSMYWTICERRHIKPTNALLAFIDDNHHSYDGSQASWIYRKYAKKWRALLRNSMGEPSIQYAKLLDRLNKKEQGPEEAITHILKHPKQFPNVLWKGAFCYALLRCLYGVKETTDNIIPHYRSEEWHALLKKTLKSKGQHVPATWKQFLPHLEHPKSFRHAHKKLAAIGRKVLSGLGFYTYHDLYIRHTPDMRA